MTNGIHPLDDPSGERGTVSALSRKRTAYFAGAALLAIVALAVAAFEWAGRDRSEGAPSITTFGDWRQIAPESNWSVWRPPCVIQSLLEIAPLENESPATATLSIATGAGLVYLVGVSSNLWSDISDKEHLSVDFGFDDDPPEKEIAPLDPVLGHTRVASAGPGFLAGVDPNLLLRMSRSATMEVYRDGVETISIDLSGAAEALEILLACALAERAKIETPAEELYSSNRPPRFPGAGNAGR